LQENYRALNPAALVPALQDEGATLTQSLAILEYLERPTPNPRCCRRARRAGPACAHWL
jgi:glutathione S-transferase